MVSLRVARPGTFDARFLKSGTLGKRLASKFTVWHSGTLVSLLGNKVLIWLFMVLFLALLRQQLLFSEIFRTIPSLVRHEVTIVTEKSCFLKFHIKNIWQPSPTFLGIEVVFRLKLYQFDSFGTIFCNLGNS